MLYYIEKRIHFFDDGGAAGCDLYLGVVEVFNTIRRCVGGRSSGCSGGRLNCVRFDIKQAHPTLISKLGLMGMEHVLARIIILEFNNSPIPLSHSDYVRHVIWFFLGPGNSVVKHRPVHME